MQRGLVLMIARLIAWRCSRPEAEVDTLMIEPFNAAHADDPRIMPTIFDQRTWRAWYTSPVT